MTISPKFKNSIKMFIKFFLRIHCQQEVTTKLENELRLQMGSKVACKVLGVLGTTPNFLQVHCYFLWIKNLRTHEKGSYWPLFLHMMVIYFRNSVSLNEEKYTYKICFYMEKKHWKFSYSALSLGYNLRVIPLLHLIIAAFLNYYSQVEKFSICMAWEATCGLTGGGPEVLMLKALLLIQKERKWFILEHPQIILCAGWEAQNYSIISYFCLVNFQISY